MLNVKLFTSYFVKVDDLLTEKAVCSMGGGRGGQPKLTISCVRKSKSTFTATAHTRLLFQPVIVLFLVVPCRYGNK